MSVPIEGSYGVRGILVTSRVFGKDIAAIGIGEARTRVRSARRPARADEPAVRGPFRA